MVMETDISRLRHIVAVGREKSFSRAAETLNISQPALSRSIAQFEERRGLKLFDRGRQGAQPTAVGKMVLADAEKILRDTDKLERRLRLYGRGEAGKIAVGMGPLVSSLILPRLSARLLSQRPYLRIATRIGTAEEMLSDLLDERIEIFVGSSDLLPDDPALSIERIGEVALSLIVRSGHPLANGKPVPQQDMAGYPMATASELPIARFNPDAGALVCQNFDLLRDLALRSDAIWLGSATLVKEMIDRGEMKLLDVDGFDTFESPLSLVRLKDRSLSPAAEALIDELVSSLASIGCD